MMKGKTKVDRQDEDILMPDPYIIDELEKIQQENNLDNNEFAHLTYTNLAIDEAPSENTTLKSIIIIEL